MIEFSCLQMAQDEEFAKEQDAKNIKMPMF